MLLLLRILFLCIVIQISSSAEIGSLEYLRDQTFNRPQTSNVSQNDGDNIDSLIGKVFGTPQPTSNPNSDAVGTCTCVPFYLCSSNQTVIEDGTGLLDIRLVIT